MKNKKNLTGLILAVLFLVFSIRSGFYEKNYFAAVTYIIATVGFVFMYFKSNSKKEA